MMMEEKRNTIRKIKETQLTALDHHRNHLFLHQELRFLFLELTQKCNENCFHCGSSCDARGIDGLSIEEYKKVMDDITENLDTSKTYLCITGGEPLLYKDFFLLMEYTKEKGLPWGMTSNATLISKDIARKLKEAGMKTISVSIDGLEKTHDRLRGRKGAFALAMAGIQNLIDQKAFQDIQVTTVINHQNIKELDALYEYFLDVDIDSWRVIGLEPIGRALDYPEMMLTREDQIRLFSFIKEKREEQMPVTYGCSHYLGLDYEREVRDWYFLCNAGIYSGSIAANGDILACLDIGRRPETIQGNIKKDRFSDVWKNNYQLYRNRTSLFCSDCKDCEHETFCAGGSWHSVDFKEKKQRVCLKNILF